MRSIEPATARELNAKLKGFAGSVAYAATRSGHNVPSNMPKGSERRSGYPEYGVRRGKMRSAAAFGFLVTGENYNAALAEFAGASGAYVKTTQGAALIRNLERRFGETGRLGWAAFDAMRPELEAAIQHAIDKAEGRTQREVDAANDRRVF
jgi:hypothetical protein